MKNEPAFPVSADVGWSVDGESPLFGMSLKDYFAAKAMQGLFSGSLYENIHPEEYATWAYERAEEMLKIRQKLLDIEEEFDNT